MEVQCRKESGTQSFWTDCVIDPNNVTFRLRYKGLQAQTGSRTEVVRLVAGANLSFIANV